MPTAMQPRHPRNSKHVPRATKHVTACVHNGLVVSTCRVGGGAATHAKLLINICQIIMVFDERRLECQQRLCGTPPSEQNG